MQVLCKSHYLELVEGGYGSSTDGDTCEASTDTSRNKNRKSKRNRTTFTDEQIHILQANFQIDCNPDGQDLERIADISGLSKRVVQVRKYFLYLKIFLVVMEVDMSITVKDSGLNVNLSYLSFSLHKQCKPRHCKVKIVNDK